MSIAAFKRSMTEAAMEDAVRQVVTRLGGRVYHVRRSDQAPEMVDFPDLVVILPNRSVVAFVELKSQTRRVTDGQHEVMEMLSLCDAVVSAIVRPEPKGNEWSYDELMDWLQGEH